MKVSRKSPASRHPRLKPHRDDSYRASSKRTDPACCPKCGATYVEGRWSWQAAPTGAASQTCPACQRIADDMPAGYVTLKGPFVTDHRNALMELVKTRAARAREEHALQRIITVRDVPEGIEVTTTDAHLARGIAVAIQDAFKGELDLTFGKDENLVRAVWTR